MRLKSANLREIEANNRVRSFLPELFYGQSLEISQPIFEERFQCGDEQRLAEAPRSGKENLVGVFRNKLVNRQLPAFFYSLPKGSLNSATVA